MPKGIRKNKPKSVMEVIASNLVPHDAKYFPGTESPEAPLGIAIPDGLRIRTVRGVEVRFIFQGERRSETIRGRTTVAFVLEVAKKRERVEQLIGLGKFGDVEYAEEFPDSPRIIKLRKVAEKAKDIMTVGRALDEWYLSRANTYGENTDSDYERAIRNQLKPFKFPEGDLSSEDFIKPSGKVAHEALITRERHLGGPARKIDPNDYQVLGNLPLASLSDVLINRIRSSLRAEPLSVKRVNNLMAPLRGAIDRQVALKKLEANPFDLIKPLKKATAKVIESNQSSGANLLDMPLPDDNVTAFLAAEGKPDPLTANEIEAVIQELDAAMANQYMFAFWSGLRTGELIALRTSDLQLERNRICVRRSLSRGILKSTKTGKERWVELMPPARAALEAQLRLLGAPDGWVFPNPFTKRRWANDSKITRRWKKALVRAGVRYRRPYQTRHTYASMMLSAGENILYVAGQLGHSDWSMLVKVYGRWIPTASAQPAGHLVAAAQAENWEKLLGLMTSRPKALADDDNDDDEREGGAVDDEGLSQMEVY